LGPDQRVERAPEFANVLLIEVQATLEGAQVMTDDKMAATRMLGSLEQTPYQDLPDMMERMSRVGIKKI